MSSQSNENMPVSEHKVDLKIQVLPAGEESLDVVAVYENSVLTGIEQTAWNLCGCDDSVQAHKFENPVLDNYHVHHDPKGFMDVMVSFHVTGDAPAFIQQVLDEYMDGFDDWIRTAENAVYSRTGSRARSQVELVNWDVQIN